MRIKGKPLMMKGGRIQKKNLYIQSKGNKNKSHNQ